MNFVPCATWIRRGICKEKTDKVQPTQEEIQRIIAEVKGEVQADDSENDEMEMDTEQVEEEEDIEDSEPAKEKKKDKAGKKSKKNGAEEKVSEEEDADLIKQFDLDNYDEDIDEGEDGNPWGISGLSYYNTNAEDPYITLKDEGDSDDEDFLIRPTDNVIAVGHTHRDFCNIEFYVHNESSGDLFCHHDFLLPTFPLCLEWMNFDPAEDKAGNFVALGSMNPHIEIWDVDMEDCLEPAYTLGTKQKKKKKKKSSTVVGHTDAVLGLSWNRHARNILASASADTTVAIWDLSQGKPATTLKHHTDKVQSILWHPFEPQSLLTGSFDKTASVVDCRSPSDNYKSWNLGGVVENVIWDHFNPFYFFSSTEEGFVYYTDVRMDKPVFTLSAHTESVTGLAISSQLPGLLITASTDKSMKVWDVQDNKPAMVLEKDMKEAVHCVSCCPEAPYIFSFGMDKELRVFDIRDAATVKNHFANRSTIIPGLSSSPAKEEEGEGEAASTEGAVADGFASMDLGANSGSATCDTTSHTIPEKKKKKKKKKAQK